MSILSGLKFFFAKDIPLAFMKEIGKVLVTKMRRMGAYYVRRNIADKFIKVTEISGRVYAIHVSTDDSPPEGHSKAWFLDRVDVLDVDFYLWAVSFPQKKWEDLPEDKKLHFHKL